MTPLPAGEALGRYFLEARSKLLDLAAILDRIDRGQGAARAAQDPRLERIRQAIQLLGDSGVGRAERIQQIFSLGYESGWEKPQPRS
jgi:hypothetical protein